MKYIYISFFIFLVLVSCVSETRKKKIVPELKYLDVFLVSGDTIEMKKELGYLKLFHKLDDTTKIVSKDKRRIYVILGLRSKENKRGRDKVSNSLNFKPINNMNDTIIIPFNITPNFKGDGFIVGVLTDTYSLHSYNDSLVRMITQEFIFEKEIYIK